MGLVSRLFRGNKKLEACLVDNAAHVTLGAQGEHVAKIQFALFSLDTLKIDRTELVTQTYGPSTAAAVLSYKTKRQIINQSYQTKPDSIVGKMTIASLDAEMRRTAIIVPRYRRLRSDATQRAAAVCAEPAQQAAAACDDTRRTGGRPEFQTSWRRETQTTQPSPSYFFGDHKEGLD